MLNSSSITRTRLGGMGNLRLRSGQHDGNRCALSGPAVKRNSTAVLLDDFFSVGHAETESLFLRRIKRLEDLLRLLFADAVTSVGDFESQRLAGVIDRDAQRAALSHGLNRIQHEVHQSPTQ